MTRSPNSRKRMAYVSLTRLDRAWLRSQQVVEPVRKAWHAAVPVAKQIARPVAWLWRMLVLIGGILEASLTAALVWLESKGRRP